MRPLVPLGLALLFSAPAFADEWTITSNNAQLTLEQHGEGRSCRVEAKRGEKPLWSAPKCLAAKGDFTFLSDDGEKVLVFHSFPETGRGMLRATGVTLYRRAEAAKSFPVGAFAKDATPLINAKRHFYWLEGALGQTGVPPGYTKDGRGVELATLDGRRWVLGFDGSLKPQKK